MTVSNGRLGADLAGRFLSCLRRGPVGLSTGRRVKAALLPVAGFVYSGSASSLSDLSVPCHTSTFTLLHTTLYTCYHSDINGCLCGQ